VYPSDDKDGEETINLTFPLKSEKKASLELNDYEFRALTKKNTLRNRVNIAPLKNTLRNCVNIAPLKNSDVRIV